MPECFEICIVYYRHYINALPFLSLCASMSVLPLLVLMWRNCVEICSLFLMLVILLSWCHIGITKKVNQLIPYLANINFCLGAPVGPLLGWSAQKACVPVPSVAVGQIETESFPARLLSSSITTQFLGLTFSSDLNLDRHVSTVSTSCFYWLCQLRHSQCSLDAESHRTALARCTRASHVQARRHDV